MSKDGAVNVFTIDKVKGVKRNALSAKLNVVQYSRTDVLEKSVLQTQRVHLFPFRTQKLSSAVVKILYGRLYGKIAQC